MFVLQRKIQSEDSRAIFVLIVAGILVVVTWMFNATLVYDDIAFPGNFSGLVNRIGWFKALVKIFCLDLPNEYRTYGLSRVIQFILWSIGGAIVPVYTLFISLSQLITVLVLYAVLVSLRIERTVALSLGFMWLFSPLIWTSCFHHYSYLILPAQLTIIGSYFLLTVTDANQRKILAVCLGVALALTGELHLVPAAVILISVAMASGLRATWRASILIISTMMLTVFTHHLIWKLFAADDIQPHRFTLNLSHDASFWTYRIFVAVRGIGRSIVDQLSEIAGNNIIWFISSTLISSIAIFSILSWVSAKRNNIQKEDMPARRPLLILATTLFVVYCIYLTMFVVVVVLADSVPQTMPRRYGYIPLTIMLSSSALFISALAKGRLGKMMILSIVLGAMVTLFVRHQGVIIPATNAADERLSRLIGNALKQNPDKVVLFFSTSEKIFPLISLDAATLGPAMREVTSAEVSQAKYGTYWPAYMNTSKVLGASLTCVLGGVLDGGKLKLVCPPWQENPGAIDASQAIIVANLGFNTSDPFGEQVQVFQNYIDFEPYFFAKEIIRNINWEEVSMGDVVAFDLGSIASNVAASDILPDKKFNSIVEKSPKNWLLNYGFKIGDDSVYKHPSLSINSEYYRSNRNGDFEYGFKFLESDLTIDLDFLELWKNRPGQRLFNIEVSWNDGLWASVGVIDPALINGNKPFSIRLVHQNTHSFSFRLSSAQGSKDIPFIQGVRITRRPPFKMQH